MSGTEKLERLDADGQPMKRPASYSPFWAVFVVFLTMGIGYAIQLGSLWNQYQQTRKTEAMLVEMLPQVRAINTKLQKVTQELIQLSATSAPARQIVADFNIQPK